MKPPEKPKRWLKTEKEIIHQLNDWDLRIWSFRLNGGALSTLERCIAEFQAELKVMEERGINFKCWCLHEAALKNLGYAYRSAGRLSEALDIFLGLYKQTPRNYHLVEDCVETYLAMNDPASAVRLLNSLQLEIIDPEGSAADHLRLWMETYPIMATDINPSLIKWAQENKSK